MLDFVLYHKLSFQQICKDFTSVLKLYLFNNKNNINYINNDLFGLSCILRINKKIPKNFYNQDCKICSSFYPINKIDICLLHVQFSQVIFDA